MNLFELITIISQTRLKLFQISQSISKTIGIPNMILV